MYEIFRRWKVDEVGVLFDREGGNEEFAGILVNPGEREPGRNWPGIRGRTDSQGLSSARFRREETIEAVRALSHPARSKGGPHHWGINTFTWGSIGSVSSNKGTMDEFLKFFGKGILQFFL